VIKKIFICVFVFTMAACVSHEDAPHNNEIPTNCRFEKVVTYMPFCANGLCYGEQIICD
jgi:hypothetical protein